MSLWLDRILGDSRTSKNGLWPTQVNGGPTPTVKAIAARFRELNAVVEANGRPNDYGGAAMFVAHVYRDNAALMEAFETGQHDLSTLVIGLHDNAVGLVRENVVVMNA